MNDFYFNNAPTVDHAAPKIAQILEHAAVPGAPGARPLARAGVCETKCCGRMGGRL